MPDNPQPETARALLWRHGLPEDVIDGALCLYAQELADAIDTETRKAKAHGVLEPDKYRPCRDASAQLRAMAGCPWCRTGIEHDVHCPTPETHNWGCGCPTDPVPADGPSRMADEAQPADGYQLDEEYAIDVDEDGRPFARVLFAFLLSVPGEKRITLVHGITKAVDGARFGAEVAEVQQPSDRAAVERVRAVLETEAVVGRSALDYRGLITSALMADEAPANIRCPDAFWTKQPHAPHDWQQEPDAPPVHCRGRGGEAQQTETTNWTPGPVAVARAGQWAREQQPGEESTS